MSSCTEQFYFIRCDCVTVILMNLDYHSDGLFSNDIHGRNMMAVGLWGGNMINIYLFLVGVVLIEVGPVCKHV